MATQMTSPFRLAAGATVAEYRLVKNSSGTAILNTVTSTDVPFGVVQPTIDGTYTSGTTLAIKDIKEGGTHKVVASTTITKGAVIYAAADGKVSPLSAVAATYRRVGIAHEAGSADGSVIEAWLNPDGHTDTVSGS